MVVFLIGYKRLLKTMLKLLKTFVYCGTAFGFFLHHSGRIPHFSPHTPPPPIHIPPHSSTTPPTPLPSPNTHQHTTPPIPTIPHFPIQYRHNIHTFPHKPRQINTFPSLNPPLLPHFYTVSTPLSTPLQPLKSPHFYPKITSKFRIFSPTLTPKNTTFCPSSPTFATLSINCKNTKNAKKSNNGTSRKTPTEIK